MASVAATMVTVELASSSPAASLAEIRPVPRTAQLGTVNEAENAPAVDAEKPVTLPPL